MDQTLVQSTWATVDATLRRYPSTLGTTFKDWVYPHVKTLPNTIHCGSFRNVLTQLKITESRISLEVKAESIIAGLFLGFGSIFTAFGIGLWLYSHWVTSPWGLWPWTFPLLTLLGVICLLIAPVIQIARPWRPLIELRDQQICCQGQTFHIGAIQSPQLRLCRVIGSDAVATYERPRPQFALILNQDGRLTTLLSFRPMRPAFSVKHIQRFLARAELECLWEPDVAYVVAK